MHSCHSAHGILCRVAILLASCASVSDARADGPTAYMLQDLFASTPNVGQSAVDSSARSTAVLALNLATVANNLAMGALPSSLVGAAGGVASISDPRLVGAVQAGGDASATTSLAQGSLLARTAAERDADVINVADFGAVGDDVADDTAAVNAAFARARTFTLGSNGPYVGTQGPFARVVFPSGRKYRITGAINATGFVGRGLDVEGGGSALDCHNKGGTCVDAVNSDFMTWNDITIIGDSVDMPRVGFQIGRITATTTQGVDNMFENLTVSGQYSLAAFYNYAGETNTFIHPMFFNYSGIAGSYALIQDGYNHFNVASQFQTVSAPVDVATSFNENLFIGADIRSNVGATIPIWLGGTSRHQFIRSYVASNSTGAVIYNEGGNWNQFVSFDAHFETSSMTDVFLFSGVNTQSLNGFEYIDHNPFPSNSIFKLSPNVTSIAIQNWKVEIGGLSATTAHVFDSPAAWTVYGSYAASSIAGFNAPAQFQGRMTVGAMSSSVNYGTGAEALQYADGTVTGGNSRGVDAIDMQTSRSVATQVAAGNYAVISGGLGNSATAAYSAVVGGVQNIASGSFSVVGGYQDTASGQEAVSVGTNNLAAGVASLVAGDSGTDRGNTGSLIWSSGRQAVQGDAEAGLHVLYGSGSGTTVIRPTVHGAAVSAASCIALPNNAVESMRITVHAMDYTTAGSDYDWSLPAAFLSRDGSVATTAFTAGTATVLTRGSVSGASVSAAADTVNGCLNLGFTPPSANTTDTWHVVARVDTVEMQ